MDGIATLGEPLRRQAAQVGMDRAERWIAIRDGGTGLEHWLQTYFGRVEAVILDFYHATEHFAELGQALHPSGEDARHTWLEIPQPDDPRSDNLCAVGRAGYHRRRRPVGVGRVERQKPSEPRRHLMLNSESTRVPPRPRFLRRTY